MSFRHSVNVIAKKPKTTTMTTTNITAVGLPKNGDKRPVKRPRNANSVSKIDFGGNDNNAVVSRCNRGGGIIVARDGEGAGKGVVLVKVDPCYGGLMYFIYIYRPLTTTTTTEDPATNNEDYGNYLVHLGHRREDNGCPEGQVQDIYGYCRRVTYLLTLRGGLLAR